MSTKGEMLILGRLKASPIERFGRNQRRAFKVAPQCGERKGVVRFKTWAEVASWRKTQSQN